MSIFFIAGMQKAGTTALHALLDDHPQIQMARNKEAHFFDDETIDWNNPDYDSLAEYFDGTTPNVIRGDATPVYSFWPRSMERIKSHNPAAKIILALRHPTFRAFSHWRMASRPNGLETLPFSDAIRFPARERVNQAIAGKARGFAYVERGFYSQQIERAFALFPRHQFHFIRTDALWLSPSSTLNALEDFLDVDRRRHPPSKYIVPLQSIRELYLPPSDRAYLDALFADDIKQTVALTGLALNDWLDPDYAEPMRAPDN